MKIGIIGAGGIASYLLPVLFRQVEAGTEIHIWDGDTLEERNLDRQLFSPDQIGMFKCEAMADLLNGGKAKISFYKNYITCHRELINMDWLFACPDNMPARRKVLEAADAYKVRAIICGNKYESASAFYYDPRFKSTGADYRVRYAASMGSNEGDPTTACTGEAQEAAPQLATANQISAAFAMGLFWFWWKKAAGVEGTSVFKLSPVEYRWAPSCVKTLTLEEATAKGETK